MKPDQVTAIVDTREQAPLDLSPLRSEPGTLATGDYSVKGLVNVIAIERKSLTDLLGCIGQERERFDREVIRLLAYPTRAIIVEATWGQIEAGNWKSKVTPAAAVGSLLGWIAQGVPVIMAKDHERAGRYVSRLLFTAARRRWREARRLRDRSAPRPTPRPPNPRPPVDRSTAGRPRPAATPADRQQRPELTARPSGRMIAVVGSEQR